MRRYGFFAIVLVLFAAGLIRDRAAEWIAATQLPALVPETSVEVRDRHGHLLRAFTVADGRWRLRVHSQGVDPGFLRMLIGYEDKRFYHHRGVDPLAMMRAAGQAVRYGRIVSGGSTLTMQVARLLEESGTGAWTGKLRQFRVALALEQRLTKAQILDLYLTLAPYGGNLEGIRAASLSYFGKEPSRLTPSEAALLVALPQSPQARRPDVSPEGAERARARVLERLAQNGVMAREDATAALRDPVPTTRRDFPALAPHLSGRAVRASAGQPLHFLTIDRALQVQAERLARQVLQGAGQRMSVAMILADHHTGDILVHVGSGGLRDATQRQGFVDMTRAIRSPGSTLKPLVYSLAFDEGLAHPASVIDDRPVAFGSYAPQNFDGAYRGELRIDEALRLSLNIPVVLLTEELGPARLTAAMRAAGMVPRIPGGKPGLAVALGGVGVSLEDLVTLYAGLAQGGVRRALNNQMGTGSGAGARFTSRASAWHVGHILGGLAPPAGAAKERLAYKTGTSYGHRDAWAVGFDGRYVAGVWMGRPDGTPVPGAFGGDLAAPVLFELVGLVRDRAEPLPPPPPEALLLDTAELPLPLQRFLGRRALFKAPEDAPKLAFPPNGSRLARRGAFVTVKLRDGTAPFTWLVNGEPVLSKIRSREAQLPVGVGFTRVSVIDAEGRAARAEYYFE